MTLGSKKISRTFRGTGVREKREDGGERWSVEEYGGVRQIRGEHGRVRQSAAEHGRVRRSALGGVSTCAGFKSTTVEYGELWRRRGVGGGGYGRIRRNTAKNGKIRHRKS